MGRFSAGNNADSQRLERVLDAKQRMIGVDVEALNAQVEENQRKQAREKAAEQQYAETSSAQVSLVTLGQLTAAAVKKDWDKEVQAFRSTCQGKPTTREWDLNRPDAKQLDLPARQGDDDPRCGPASLQRFAGEDLTVAERTAAQMEQCKAWWDEQLATKEAQRQHGQQQKQALATTIKTLDSLQCTMMSQEAAARAQLQAQVAAANKELGELQAARKNAERQAELQDKLAELEAAAANPWLNENPDQAASALSPARVRKDHWKGMSQAQRDAILQQQLEQVEARKAAAAMAAAEEAAAAAAQRNIHKAIMQQALSADAFKRKQAEAAAAVLKEQMAAKAAKDAAEKELYANKVTEGYFQQFGTSHR